MKLLDSPLPGHTALLASALTLALLAAAPQDATGQALGNRYYENFTRTSLGDASTDDGSVNRWQVIDNVNDNNTRTYWQTGKSGSTSLEISFRSSQNFSRMVVTCPNLNDNETRPATIKLEIRNGNNQQWQEVETFSYNRGSSSMTFDFGDVSASRVRLSMTTWTTC